MNYVSKKLATLYAAAVALLASGSKNVEAAPSKEIEPLVAAKESPIFMVDRHILRRAAAKAMLVADHYSHSSHTSHSSHYSGRGGDSDYSSYEPASTPAPATPPPTPIVQTPRAAPAQPVHEMSDIDRPHFQLKTHPADFALIVGISEYENLPKAEYAERDAKTVKQYMLHLGIPERNIILLSGQKATRTQIQAYLEEWLPKNVGETSTVFFYYAGHGIPDAKTKEAFITPWDADAEFIRTTAYPLRDVYFALSNLKARKVIVALDSCFSGTGGRSILPSGTRPLVTELKPVADSGRLMVFSAASGEEITGTLEKQHHGIFTYYFLKGLGGAAKDSSGEVTTKSLMTYIKPLVEDAARRQNREQTPGYSGATDVVLRRF